MVTVARARSRPRGAWNDTIECLKHYITTQYLHFIPHPYEDALVRVKFFQRSDTKCAVISIEPDDEEDIEMWLLGDPSDPTKVPQVNEATKKGAHFLVAQVPGWDDFGYLIPKIFVGIERVSEPVFVANDSRLGDIKGIVFITGDHRFAIVGNREIPAFYR